MIAMNTYAGRIRGNELQITNASSYATVSIKAEGWII